MTQAGRAEFVKALNVSRETLARFDLWQSLLVKWSKKINLVSLATLDEFWGRHVLDSAQLSAHAPQEVKRWLDLGSGAGFPGLAIALLRMEEGKIHVTLVESNGKKAAFLRMCVQETGAPAEVICARSESLLPQVFDVVSARALAPLPKLLGLSAPFCGPGTLRLFHKGAKAQEEIDAAKKDWVLRLESLPSLTDKDASVLKIMEANRV